MSGSFSEKFNASDWFIERSAVRNIDKVAFYSDKTLITYGELREKVSQVANALRTADCHPGDRVFIALHDSGDFVSAFFGATKIGAIAVPFRTNASVSELLSVIGDSDPAVIIAEPEIAEIVTTHVSEVRSKLFVVGLHPDDHDEGFANWSHTLAAEPGTASTHATHADDPAVLLYTSGSTGKPKGVLHAHKSMMAASLNFATSTLGIRADDRVYSISKLPFAYGLGNGMYYPLSVGASAILSRQRFRWTLFKQTLTELHPTVLFTIPTLLSELLNEMDHDDEIDLSTLRMIVSAGEHLHSSLFERFRTRTNIEVLNGLGMTEMLQTCISNRPGCARPGSCGQLVPGYDAAVMGDNNTLAADGIVGSLWLRGPSSLIKYWNRPDVTEKVQKGDGWIATGDRVHRDPDGYFFYHGRTDESLKIRGLWVSPVDIESVILSLSGVARVKVLISRIGTEQPKITAYIVFGNSSEEVRQAAMKKLPDLLPQHMIPHSVVKLDVFPLLSNGKVDISRLRDLDTTERECMQSETDSNSDCVLPQLEHMLCDLLQRQTVNPRVNFLDMGGDSLIATRLLSQIQATFHVDVSIEELFQSNATLEKLANVIAQLTR